MGESQVGAVKDMKLSQSGHIDIPVRKGIRREYPPASPTSPRMQWWIRIPRCPPLDPHPDGSLVSIWSFDESGSWKSYPQPVSGSMAEVEGLSPSLSPPTLHIAHHSRGSPEERLNRAKPTHRVDITWRPPKEKCLLSLRQWLHVSFIMTVSLHRRKLLLRECSEDSNGEQSQFLYQLLVTPAAMMPLEYNAPVGAYCRLYAAGSGSHSTQ
jgi:hypothetical protein